jgi:sulfatase maturation enzyme AslB (radical SAM superfamily)
VILQSTLTLVFGIRDLQACFHLLQPIKNESIKKMSIVADNTPPANPPPGFHLLAKPSGSTCNIDCKYCFFLLKEALYPNDRQRMSEDILETYIRQLWSPTAPPK